LSAGGSQVLPADGASFSATVNEAGEVFYGADFAVSLDTGLLGANNGLVLRDPKTQQLYVQKRDAGGRIQATPLGQLAGPSWRVAGVGHWDGDGVRDLLLHDPQTGRLEVWHLGGLTRPQVRATDTPEFTVPAGWDVAAVYDHDGNGTTD